jgi:hypothetical protein
MPYRVKREYFKKFPPNTKSVTRPHKFGNPLKLVGKNSIYIDASYRKEKNKWAFLSFGDLDFMLKIYSAILYRDYEFFESNFPDSAITDLQYWVGVYMNLDFGVLKGKNLACFCKLENPCHADILMKFVNS